MCWISKLTYIISTDAPLVTAWHSYRHNATATTLEIVCSVTAHPPAKVSTGYSTA